MKKLAVVSGLLVLSACLGQHSRTALDEIEAEVSDIPVVEAFVEYGGPQEKWAGPAPFILHIDAREGAPAQVAMTPNVFQEVDFAPVIRGGGRMPASTADLTAERVRERLGAFRDELANEATPFSGCMSPLRIRLVAGNGALVERQGCRDTHGWAKSASQLVADFMAAAAQAQADRDAALSAEQAQAAGN